MISPGSTGKVLCILYSSGGLGDVGRHATRAALDLGPEQVSKIKVLSTQPPEFLLKQARWNCGCNVDHAAEFTPEELQRMDILQVNFDEIADLNAYLVDVDAVVSCLGNRQFFLGDRVASVGTRKLVDAMNFHEIKRGVFMSSMGIGDDWPPAEWHWGGKIMSCLFRTISKREFKDLSSAEETIVSAKNNIDYTIVRPAGLGEDVFPTNEWQLQKKKHQDEVEINLAKLDCARFMVQEALNPTIHNKAVVIGGKVKDQKLETKKDKVAASN